MFVVCKRVQGYAAERMWKENTPEGTVCAWLVGACSPVCGQCVKPGMWVWWCVWEELLHY